MIAPRSVRRFTARCSPAQIRTVQVARFCARAGISRQAPYILYARQKDQGGIVRLRHARLALTSTTVPGPAAGPAPRRCALLADIEDAAAHRNVIAYATRALASSHSMQTGTLSASGSASRAISNEMARAVLFRRLESFLRSLYQAFRSRNPPLPAYNWGFRASRALTLSCPCITLTASCNSSTVVCMFSPRRTGWRRGMCLWWLLTTLAKRDLTPDGFSSVYRAQILSMTDSPTTCP